MPFVIDELPNAQLAPSSSRSRTGVGALGAPGAAGGLANRDEAVRISRDSAGESAGARGGQADGLPPLATPEPSGSSESVPSIPANIKIGRRRWVVTPGQKPKTLPDRPDSKWNQIAILEKPLAPLKAPRVRRGPPENWPNVEHEAEEIDDEDYMYRWECVRAGLVASLPPFLKKRFVKEESNAEAMVEVPDLPGAMPSAPPPDASGSGATGEAGAAGEAAGEDGAARPDGGEAEAAPESAAAGGAAEAAAGTGAGSEAPGPPGVVPPAAGVRRPSVAPGSGSRPLTARDAPKPEDLDPNKLAEAETVNLSYQDLGDPYQLVRLRQCMKLVENCKHLYLGDNVIKSMAEFTFPNLEVLYLCRNEIESFGDLPKAPRLRVLNLAGNQIGAPAVESGELAKLETVERLVLRGNPIAYMLGYRHWVAKAAHPALQFLDDEALLRTTTEEDRLLDSEAEEQYEEAEEARRAAGFSMRSPSRASLGSIGSMGSAASIRSWGSDNTFGGRRRRRRRGRLRWLPALPERCSLM